jgi:hypothetical protein
MTGISIVNAVDEIASALVVRRDPLLALHRATYWSKTIGTDRAYLLAMAKKQVREGKDAISAAADADMESDLLEIGRLMHRWGWEQIERRCGTTVVTQPEQGQKAQACGKAR